MAPNASFTEQLAVNFSFRVDLLTPAGMTLASGPGASFQEVSGISAEVETEQYHQGGQNQYQLVLPKVVRYTNLKLKRGVLLSDHSLLAWCSSTFASDSALAFRIRPQTVAVSLISTADPDSQVILKSWNFFGAWPVKWELGDLDAMQGAVLVENLELAYNYFTSVK